MHLINTFVSVNEKLVEFLFNPHKYNLIKRVTIRRRSFIFLSLANVLERSRKLVKNPTYTAQQFTDFV